jgi:predicted transcriptional regulator
MKFPCETIVWEVLPCIRAALTLELIEKGLSQNEISKMLGITQAAVSHYISKKRGSGLDFPEDAKEEIEQLADDFVQGSVDDLVLRICKICMMVRADETVCNLDLCEAKDAKD